MSENKTLHACSISGKTNDLVLYSIPDKDGNIIGWFFLNKDESVDDISFDVRANKRLSDNMLRVLEFMAVPRKLTRVTEYIDTVNSLTNSGYLNYIGDTWYITDKGLNALVESGRLKK